MKKIKLFEAYAQHLMFERLLESVTGDIKDVQAEVKDVMDELGKEGAEDDEIKAALLMQAMDNDGDLEEIDVDKLKDDVKEGMAIRGQSLNESAGGLVQVIEIIGNIAGNSAFLEFLSDKIQKATGKKMDVSKLAGTINKIAGGLKKITGLPAKAIEKFFGWIGKKIGLDSAGKKGLELVGAVAVIVFFFALGVIHFPVLGTGIIWWLLSLTGLVGKSVELIKIGKEIAHAVRDAVKNKDKTKEEMGVAPEELEKLAEV